MNKNIVVKSIVFVVAVILTAALISESRAAAQDGVSASFEANPDRTIGVVDGGPGFVMIPSAAFVPDSNTAQYSRGAVSVWSTDETLISFSAPVFIPDGAVINQLVLYYDDSLTDFDILVTFYEYDSSNDYIVTIKNISSSGSGGVGAAIASLSSEVSNQYDLFTLKAYFPAAAGAGNQLKLLGVRCDYGYSSYLSLISK